MGPDLPNLMFQNGISSLLLEGIAFCDTKRFASASTDEKENWRCQIGTSNFLTLLLI